MTWCASAHVAADTERVGAVSGAGKTGFVLIKLSPASLTDKTYPSSLQFDTMKRADRAVIASPPDATRLIVAAGSGPAVAAKK